MESLIQKEKECFICGTTLNLENHHALHGNANRRLCDADRLTVWLCQAHHHELHDSDTEMDRFVQRAAQEVWEKTYGDRSAFIRRYGKSYI